jgi:hypothetical protein
MGGWSELALSIDEAGRSFSAFLTLLLLLLLLCALRVVWQDCMLEVLLMLCFSSTSMLEREAGRMPAHADMMLQACQQQIHTAATRQCIHQIEDPRNSREIRDQER